MERRARRAILLCLAAFWLTLFVLTHLPASHLPRVRASDKTLHGTAYFLLAGLLWLNLAVRSWSVAARCAVVFGAMALYGAVDEVTQGLVGRHVSAGDWLADCAGAAAAPAVLETAAWTRRRLGRREAEGT